MSFRQLSGAMTTRNFAAIQPRGLEERGVALRDIAETTKIPITALEAQWQYLEWATKYLNGSDLDEVYALADTTLLFEPGRTTGLFDNRRWSATTSPSAR